MDRRQHPRKPCLLKVYLRLDEATWEGTILNYSESGVFVAASRSIAVEDRLRMRFRRPDDAAVVEVDGVVKRVIAEPGSLGGDTGYGIQLVEMMSTATSAKGASGVFERPKLRETGSSHSGERRRVQVPPGPATPSEVRAAEKDSRARDSRFVTYIKTTFTPLTGQGVPLDGEFVNVSRHGLFMHTPKPPQTDAVLSLRIDGWDVDGSQDALDLIVQVQWNRPPGDPSGKPAGTGMRIIGFATPSAQKRFESLLRALLVVGNPIVGK